MVTGIMLVIVGVSLATFTDLTVSMGTDGVLMIGLIIGLGLLLLIPSKIYLTLLLLQKNDWGG
ncbi:hypothetical protein [Psychromonas sp. MME2]|uniref:hypothetical protein n=1 Tax=unclassified Psychromonas TaxID=2614957 RepID=UPI00339C178F